MSTITDVLDAVSTITTNYNANLAQFTTWQSGSPTGGAANDSGAGSGGPFYPLTDMSGTVRWFRGLQYYVALLASAVPSTGGAFSGGISAPAFVSPGFTISGSNVYGPSTAFAATIGANPAASITAGGYLQVYGSAHGSGARAIIGCAGAALQINAAGFITPHADNGLVLGSGPLRYAAIYVSSGVINTSDQREKDWRGALTDAELRVAKRCARMIGVYRWKDAIAEKGDAARLHVGVLAQEVRDAFTDEGLDGTRYGLLCHDAWEATAAVPAQPHKPAVLNDAGEVVEAEQPALPGRPAVAAGDRWGVRMDELALFIAAGQEQRLAALEA